MSVAAKRRGWLLTIAVQDPQRGFKYFHMLWDEGRTAVDAFLAMRKTNRESFRIYAEAELINAWPMSYAQADEEGFI